MILDIHTHIFPHLSGASGFESIDIHRKYLQKFTSVAPAQAVRRLVDGSVVEDSSEWELWDKDDPTFAGAYDVDFRVGRFGRFEWTKDGIDYYLHLYAPNFQDMESSPEFLLTQMNYNGIGRAVLQNAWLYGQLNDYFAEAVRKYPDRFIGTAQVNEARAYEEGQISELRRAVQVLGLQGLYFATARFFENRYQYGLDDPLFFPFWEEVAALGIPVFWDLSAIREPGQEEASTYELFLHQMSRFGRWLEQFPRIPSILVHGVPLRYIRQGDEIRPIPDEIWTIWRNPNVFVELLFPMQVSHPAPGGSVWDYPYRQVNPLIEALYNRLGAEKLVWGSDLPNVERNCTYKQSLTYLLDHVDFISGSDMDRIVGGNAAELYAL